MGALENAESGKLDVRRVREQLGIVDNGGVAEMPINAVPRGADGKVSLDALREMVSQKTGSDKIEVTTDGKIMLDGEEIGEIKKETI